MQFRDFNIGPGHPCHVIAEIGQNHNGDVYHAIRLIQTAASCGADSVKLQARDRFEEFEDSELREAYGGRNSFGKTYGEHRQFLDLQDEDFQHIKERHRYNDNPCNLFCTVCAVNRLDWLEKNKWCKMYKIASKDMLNQQLVQEVARTGKPLIISTGKAENLAQIESSLSWASIYTEVALMHCVSKYPTPPVECRLREIERLRSAFGVIVGYSDHTAGVKAPATAAIKYAADLVEVHLTMNRALPGTDHAASLEPPGLSSLCGWIKQSSEMH